MKNLLKEGAAGGDFSYPSMNAFIFEGETGETLPARSYSRSKTQLAGPMSQKNLSKAGFPEKEKRRYREKNNGGVNTSSHLGGVCLREKPELFLIVFS
jgi:hypothetical protein